MARAKSKGRKSKRAHGPLKTQAKEPLIRCVYSKLEDPRVLVAHPRNPNKHSTEQIAMLAAIIAHQGWRSALTISKRSGFVVTGNGRLEAALHLGVKQAPVDYQDFETESDEFAHMLADNKIAELAELNFQEVAGLLKEIKIDLALTGFRDFEIEPLLQATFTPATPDKSTASGTSQTVHFILTHEQHKIVEKAVGKMRTLQGDENLSDGECLALICKAFLK